MRVSTLQKRTLHTQMGPLCGPRYIITRGIPTPAVFLGVWQSPVDLLGGRSGVTERLAEPLADPGDLKAALVTVEKVDLVPCGRKGANPTHLLSTANRSSISEDQTNEQAAGYNRRRRGRFSSKGVKNESLDVVGQTLAFPEDIPGAVENNMAHPSMVWSSERQVLPVHRFEITEGIVYNTESGLQARVTMGW